MATRTPLGATVAWLSPAYFPLPPGHRAAWLVGFVKKTDTQEVTIQMGRRKNELAGWQQGKEEPVQNDRAAETIPRNPRSTDPAAQTTHFCAVSSRGSPSSRPPGGGAAW